MGKIYLPGTLVQDYVITELAGDGTQSNVYLAERGGTSYWLLQLEDKHFDPPLPAVQVERFDILGEGWIALNTSGTTIVNLASWVDKLEPAFIGWRWAILGRSAALLHETGSTMQHTHPLSFERLAFNAEGELIFVQGDLHDQEKFTFPPPEGRDTLTPAGDVYSLAASLKELMGNTVPFAVAPILEKGMAPLPAKRYKNAHVFGEELADVLPDPNRVKQPKPPTPVRSYFRWGCYAVMGLLAVCCLLFTCGVIYTLRDPDFQRQFQREFERQLQEQQR